MIAAWMLWSAGIGVLFLVAGLAAERLLALGRRPTRWVWVAAGAATVTLPLLRMLGRSPSPAAVPPMGEPVLLEPLALTVSHDSVLHSLDDLLMLGWVVLSLLLVITVLFAFARLVREGKSWQPGLLGSRSVFWSRNTGPTIVGLVRPRVVLPTWVRAIGPGEQELILTHEEEHIHAGDSKLRFLMTLAVLAFPWNPALWLQRHRLGLAIELDCDRRVMRRMPGERRAYGDLLLRVGASQSGLHRLAIVSLAEGRSQLERRIRGLVQGTPRARRVKITVLMLGVAALVALAVLLPRIRGEGGPVDDQLAEFMAEPTFTPFTVRPDLVNEEEVRQAMEDEYPPVLRDAEIGGRVIVHFFIDTEGEVQRTLVANPSAHEELDSAAVRVARRFRFTPALNLDERVPVWIAIPLVFGTPDEADEGQPDDPAEFEARLDSLGRFGTDSQRAMVEQMRETLEQLRRERAGDSGNPPADPGAAQEASLSDAPTFTPYSVRPDLVNEREVQRALEREYPPILRDAGIEGTINVRFFIDTGGVVQRVLVAQSSGHEALDSAALRVARVFRFSPALDEDEPVPVWISIPISFELRRELSRAGQSTRDPSGPMEEPSARERNEADADSPAFPPFTVRPDLVNEPVGRAIEREYPPILRNAGIGGTVRVRFFIDDDGEVQRTLLARTSGHASLDEAALRVADVFRFTPALDLDEPASGAPVADTPSATPYTVPPNLSNEEEVQQAIDDEYPAMLRDAGIGGTVHVQIFVDVAGVVQNAVVGRSSGHDPLDEAALRAARVMRFTPALDVDEPVPVWIAIPITFIADGRVYRMAGGDTSASL